MRNARTKASASAATVTLAVVLLALLGNGPLRSQAPVDGDRQPPEQASSSAPSTLGFFSAAQAERGAALYGETCSECHTTSQFRGPDFEWRWRRQTAWELFREISTTMPENLPGSLEPAAYAAIVAYLLSLNEYREGDIELEPTREALSAITLGGGAPKTPSSP
jgi:mono/diheme cytochrome c family protein